ncbi:MAG TPA: hypothetical protein IAD23_07135 [Candidatus Scubalenecus merdavium]|uniref:beta-galactosidase n=1 Tax=Candidatus Scybalenecus merdavium TaxID=2840939 RepID=A0A9D1SPL4_9FIRM|nr:hypothetical protein [Candidatus Scubalenecus merdavium]
MNHSAFYNPVWHTPVLPPIPQAVLDCHKPSLSLADRANRDWQFLFEEIADIPSPFSEKQDYDFQNIPSEKWQPVTVPGELVMQGFDIENNREYYYRRTVMVPSDFPKGRLYIRLEGVYCNARVWVNGKFVRFHIGGFTPWDCDITDYIDQNKFELVVGVADIEGKTPGIWNPQNEYLSDASWASYYAHHNIGGILRGITLFVLPESRILRTYLNTELTDDYRRAKLHANLQIDAARADLQLEVQLQKDGKTVCSATYEPANMQSGSLQTEPRHMTISANTVRRNVLENDRHFQKRYMPPAVYSPAGKIYEAAFCLEIDGPQLWDAEHPDLYELKISLLENERILQTNVHLVGLRQIEYGGMHGTEKNKIYINGKEIKLRGVCRHDVSAQFGRSVDDRELEKELHIYKRNNINFIRTSHYPAPERLLALCDQIGIYVEQENSACFKGANNFKIYCPPENFINTFAEMTEFSRNHACVIIWSLANESGFEQTAAFRREFEYIKAQDTTRPVIFSYPHTVKTTPLPYDIRSHHYKKVTSNLGRKDMPMLHDEFAHVPCYNTKELQFDNSSRLFWGHSVKKGWDNIFETDGALGCALWAAVDDVFFIPDGTKERHQNHASGPAAGYGEWGAVLDAFHREKPEAFLTKKAFTPILLDEEKSSIQDGLSLYVHNRFDHTNLNEVRLICQDEAENMLFDGYIPADIAPHQKGLIRLANVLCEGSAVKLSFYHQNLLTDTYILNKKQPSAPPPAQSAQLCRVLADHKNGVLIWTDSDRSRKITGPYLYKNGKRVDTVQTVRKTAHGYSVHIRAKKQPGIFCAVHCKTESYKMVCAVQMTQNLLNTFSVGFVLQGRADFVQWQRHDLYNTYPKTHIGRTDGIAHLNAAENAYGQKTNAFWKDDVHNFFLQKENKEDVLAGSNDFRTRRNDINTYTAALCDGTKAEIHAKNRNIWAYACCWKNKPDTQLLIGSGQFYPDLQWGNAFGRPAILQQFSFEMQLAKQNLTAKAEND